MFRQAALFVSILFSGIIFCSGQDIKPVVSAIQNFKALPGMQNASIGFCLSDPENGKVLFSDHDSESLVPASCLKIATTGAGLGLLGKEHRYYTRIGYDGTVNTAGVLHGDIVVKGGGDPMLGSDRLDDNRIAGFGTLINEFKKAGIKTMDGNLIVDCSYFDDETICKAWGYDDIGNYFGAGCYGLNYRDNTYSITLKPGLKAGSTVKFLSVSPSDIGLKFENRLVSGNPGSGDASNIFGEPNEDCRVLQGTIPASKSTFSIKGSMPDPPGYFGKAFASALSGDGILTDYKKYRVYTCEHPAQFSHFVCVDSIVSPSLEEIVYYTNGMSVNLYAECLMKETGKVVAGNGSRQSGEKVIKKYWSQKGVDTAELIMEDGSGLSRNDRISAFQLTKMLCVIRNEGYFDAFLNSLPVSGLKGAMKGMGKGASIQGRIYCKTGHLSGVRAYSGYIKTGSGKWLCFSLIVNNYEISSGQIHDEIEKVLEAMGEL
jgi:serine-type D-Ala-D-Ala carboxypeptidase/endopeptidase (penicillin-binding protein 4)